MRIDEGFLTPEAIARLQQEEALSDKTHKRTAQQIEAIYSSGQNILVSASAGSGKTFVMVERILDKILRGIPVDRLFISTFTVKAATELIERIEKKLHTAIAETEDYQLKAYLNDQLQALSQADIGTMDAFAQKLVHQHGYVLGISPHFRIIQDKAEQDILKREVFSQVFEAYMAQADNKDFIQLVQNFSGRCKDSSAFREIVDSIYAFSQSTTNPSSWLAEVFLRGAKTYTSFADIPDQAVNALLACMQDTADQLRDLTDMEGYAQTTKAGKLTAKYTKHLKMIDSLYEWALHFDSLYGKARLGQLAQELTALLPSGADITVAGHKYPIFKSLQEQLVGFRHLETILAYQQESLPLLEVLQAFVISFSEAYLAAKMQENAFEFSDIAHFAIEILQQAPDIRQAYQGHYHEIMVDEYQDNNHMQERLLELLSNGHNRFMVGDIKQSIYRFRQADPQIFNQKFKDYQSNPEHGKLILLKENFRSQSEVLNVTNAVFSRLMDESLGEITYDDKHQLVAGSEAQKQLHPENRAQLLIYNTDQAQEGTEEALANDGISAGEVILVAKEIIRLYNEEKVAFEDITLLVSSRTRNDTIFQVFNQYGIPLVADGGQENYLKSVEVMVMLDTLRSINNPLNDYALVALMRSPMFSFDEDQLARISLQSSSQDQPQAFYDKLSNSLRGQGEHPGLIGQELMTKLVDFDRTLSDWRQFAKLHSLYELIWKIFNDRFYFDFVASQPKAEQAQTNLYALAIRADQFEQSGYKGLSRFIGMIDKVLETQNDLADVEVERPKHAVNLMTIHKSKGLEFHYVFILNCDKRFAMADLQAPIILNRDEGIGIKYVANVKELLREEKLASLKVTMETLPYQLNKQQLRLATLSEQMRLLYVAMTRAEKKVYLIGKASKEKVQEKTADNSSEGRLALASRERLLSFQDWLLAIVATFSKEDLFIDVRFVDDSDLTPEAVGQLRPSGLLQADDLKDNRQTEDIARALDMLDKVSKLNASYQAAIELPTVRTPSQLKTLYEPLMDTDGVDIIDQLYHRPKSFELPDFSKKKAVEPSQVGSSLHELMQRIPMSDQVTAGDIEQALQLVSADAEVKARLDIEKVTAFFATTELGKLLQEHHQRLYREAPFAMLKKDSLSQEQYVVRGIIDGYLLFEDRIVLFDYKTDRYQQSAELKQRYQQQMDLYAEALSQSYGIARVEKYLVLMGGPQLEVVRLDE